MNIRWPLQRRSAGRTRSLGLETARSGQAAQMRVSGLTSRRWADTRRSRLLRLHTLGLGRVVGCGVGVPGVGVGVLGVDVLGVGAEPSFAATGIKSTRGATSPRVSTTRSMGRSGRLLVRGRVRGVATVRDGGGAVATTFVVGVLGGDACCTVAG